jgi:hypothetical protein
MRHCNWSGASADAQMATFQGEMELQRNGQLPSALAAHRFSPPEFQAPTPDRPRHGLLNPLYPTRAGCARNPASSAPGTMPPSPRRSPSFWDACCI